MRLFPALARFSVSVGAHATRTTVVVEGPYTKEGPEKRSFVEEGGTFGKGRFDLKVNPRTSAGEAVAGQWERHAYEFPIRAGQDYAIH